MLGRIAAICLLVMAAIATPSRSEQNARSPCFAVHGGIDVRGQEKRTNICRSEVRRLLRAPIASPLEWPKYKSEGQVTNCREYLSAIGYGNYWTSRAELPMEVPYIRTCGLLVALGTAKRGRNAFKSISQALSMASLPPTIAFHVATSDQYEELQKLEAQGVSAGDLVLNRNWQRDSDVSISIIAVADVDGDGTNDYIVARSYSCTGQCSYSSFAVGYLSPKPNSRVMRWVQFDHERIRLPNPSLQTR